MVGLGRGYSSSTPSLAPTQVLHFYCQCLLHNSEPRSAQHKFWQPEVWWWHTVSSPSVWGQFCDAVMTTYASIRGPCTGADPFEGNVAYLYPIVSILTQFSNFLPLKHFLPCTGKQKKTLSWLPGVLHYVLQMWLGKYVTFRNRLTMALVFSLMHWCLLNTMKNTGMVQACKHAMDSTSGPCQFQLPFPPHIPEYLEAHVFMSLFTYSPQQLLLYWYGSNHTCHTESEPDLSTIENASFSVILQYCTATACSYYTYRPWSYNSPSELLGTWEIISKHLFVLEFWKHAQLA